MTPDSVVTLRFYHANLIYTLHQLKFELLRLDYLTRALRAFTADEKLPAASAFIKVGRRFGLGGSRYSVAESI